jgi:drug/metabolite transporter (DMT)-like permease
MSGNSGAQGRNLAGALAIFGFVLVAVTQATNPILSRGLGGSVPPFSLAFFRWTIVAAGLAPFALADIRTGKLTLRGNILGVAAAGFLGVFLCGAPVYVAGITTSAINIALIMGLSPVVVLMISRLFGLEHINALQWIGTFLAMAGALLIVSRGDPRTLLDLKAAQGDYLVVLAMLGWSGYALVQSRIAPRATFLARVSVFMAAGALFSLPFAVFEMARTPAAVFNLRAAGAYVFAGLVPGLIAYAGFAYLGARFGSVRSSIAIYIVPIASALLSFALLGEPPGLIHAIGGAMILGGAWATMQR